MSPLPSRRVHMVVKCDLMENTTIYIVILFNITTYIYIYKICYTILSKEV